jgi:hypothetical protein
MNETKPGKLTLHSSLSPEECETSPDYLKAANLPRAELKLVGNLATIGTIDSDDPEDKPPRAA